MSRTRRFCFTLNNPVIGFDYYKKLDQSAITRFIFGYEIGEQQTPHLQGYVEYKYPQRLTEVNKVLTCHWEVAKGDSFANYTYCSKSGQVQLKGDWSKEKQGKKRKSPDSAKEVIQALLDPKKREDMKCTSNYLYRKKAYDERVQEIQYLQALHSQHEIYKDSKLFQWQVDVLDQLFSQNNRKILWVYDEEGGCGKSYLARVLAFKYGYDLFDGVTSCNHVAYLISESPRGFVFDVTRADSSHFSYNTLESVKNGFVMSGKYAGIKRIFKPVPVIVFANFAPDTSSSSTLSADRWQVHHVSSSSSVSPPVLPSPPSSYCPPSLPSILHQDAPISSNEPEPEST